jgi:hypothetical protein
VTVSNAESRHGSTAGVSTATRAAGEQAGTEPNGLRYQRWLSVIIAAFAVGSVCTSASLLLTVLLVRLLLNDASDSARIAFVAGGTVAGACLGGWFAQPILTRFVGLFRRAPN